MIKVLGLEKSYGSKQVLKGVELEVNKGEFVSVIGRNGTGKTTLVDIISKVKKADGGTVQYDFDEKKMYHYIGVQTQEADFDTRLKVRDLCCLWMDIYKKKKSSIMELLNFLQLEEVWNQSTGSLSGGQKQKLNIMLSLIHDPDFIILDELTTGLDAISRAEIQNYLSTLIKDKGKTILMISHYMDEVEALSDRIYVLKDGVIFDSGTPKELSDKYECTNMQEFAVKCLA